MFSGLALWIKLAAAAALLAAVVTVYGVWHHAVYTKGYDKAIADVAAKDKGALNAIAKQTSKVDACYDGGGSWSTADGVCKP